MVEERTVVAEFVDLSADRMKITLVDEKGNESNYLILAGMGIEENNYIVALPLEEVLEPDEEEVVIFKIFNDHKGDEKFMDIEDDEEWDVAAQAWQEYVDQRQYN